MTRPVWAEIDLDNLAHNVREIRNITDKDAEIMAVVKADAYKHGAFHVGKTALQNGAERLGVAIIEEAIELRESGIEEPIEILGYTQDADLKLVLEYDLTQTIYNYDQAEELSDLALKRGKRGRVHIKIDTGMGRLGFLSNLKNVETVGRICCLPGLFVEGIYTHFATADSADKTYAEKQFQSFSWFLDELEKRGIHIPVKHAANSAAVIDLPQTHLDMVRPGIILYGIYPSAEVKKSRISLRPVMSIKAQVASIKRLEAGAPISYGATHITDKESRIAVLPLGYADGYRWALSNNGEVLIKGQRVPVVGRICMDQFMVDVTNVPGVKIGDEAVILGMQGSEEITADEVAERINTISYEVVCMVSERIPKRYVSKKVPAL